MYITLTSGAQDKLGEKCANPFDDIRDVVQQQELPALGRGLFSEAEDKSPILPAITPEPQTRPLPSVPVHRSDNGCSPSHGQGDVVARLPTPNFATVHNDVQQAHDLDTRLGLFFKLTQPFRILKARSKSSNNANEIGSRTDSLRTLAGTRDQVTELQVAQPEDLLYMSAPPPQAISSISRRNTNSSGGSYDTALSRLSGSNTLRLMTTEIEPLSRHTTKSTRFLDVPEQEEDEDDAVSEAGSSNEGLLDRQAPHSPALLAATYAAIDRFTRRFPVSLSYHEANSESAIGRDGEPDEQNLLPLLGYGETGAIVERPNVWTPEKWALLFSVCSVSS
jgi:hypothetical protein